MAEINLTRREYGFGKTYRKDSWWVYPLFVFIALSLFVIYVTWAAWQGNNYWWGTYLSPLYSPEFFGSSPHRWFGPETKWWPSAVRFARALLVLWSPGLFRLPFYFSRVD